MRKILISFMCFMLSLTFAVSAQVSKPAIDSSTFTLSLSGTSSTKNGTVTVIVTKPSYVLSDCTASTLFEKTAYIAEHSTNEQGVWQSGEVMITEPQSNTDYGWYLVYVSGEDAVKFYLAYPSELSDAVTAIRNANAANLYSVMYEYTVAREILSLNLAGDYARLADTSEKSSYIHNIILKGVRATSDANAELVTDVFEDALEYARYSYGTASDIHKALTDNRLDISFDSSAGIANIASKYESSRTVTDDKAVISKNLRTAIALLKVNAATKGEMTDIFEEYNDVLSLDLAGDYSGVDKVAVNKELLSPEFATVGQLKESFNSAVALVKGGGGSTAAPSINQNNNTPGSVTSSVSVSKGSSSSVPGSTQTSVTGSGSSHFNDLGDVLWAEEYVNKLADKGIVNGVAPGYYAPMENVTREQYLKMLLNAFGVECEYNDTLFNDVDKNAWYAPFVSWATQNGIVNGESDRYFGIGNYITREQMAVMTQRTMEYFGRKLAKGSKSFTDSSLISSYALDAVSKMQQAGIINGMPDGSFSPFDALTRAQAAKVVYIMMEVSGLNG